MKSSLNQVYFTAIIILASLILFSCTREKTALSNSNLGGSVKWHPGHYVKIKAKDTDTALQRRKDVENNKYLKGVLVMVNWQDIEGPKEGDYHFAVIEEYVNWARENGKYVFFQIKDRCFHGCLDAASPAYLMTDLKYNGGVSKMYSGQKVKGSVVKLWEPAVVDRLIALNKALAVRYDRDAHFMGLYTEETAIGLGKPKPLDYNSDAYLSQLKRLLVETKKVFPHTMFIMAMNFAPGAVSGLRPLAEKMVEIGGCGIGHPDTLPWRMEEGKLTPGYQIEMEFKGKVAIAPMVNTSDMKQTDTAEKVYQMAINTLGANYIFWEPWFYTDSRNKTGASKPDWWEGEVLPLLEKYHGAAVSDCPSSFSSCGS